MKPLEETDSSDCFSNVHLCGQLGSGSGSSWGWVWNSHKQESEIFFLCLDLCDTSLAPGLLLLSPSKLLAALLKTVEILSSLISVYPSFIQTDKQTSQAGLQIEESALIQILCKWFVRFLSFCSCLIELCCFVSAVIMELLFLHSNFLSDWVSCLSSVPVEMFLIISHSITMLQLNATVHQSKKRITLFLEPLIYLFSFRVKGHHWA